MRYHSQLIEATLLKRPISFLMEVVLQSRRRIMIRCPHLGSLSGCDILGTQLWFSAPSNGHCLPTLELVEVNDGFLVGVNPEILSELVKEAIELGIIQELNNYKVIENNINLNYQQDNIIILNLQRNLLDNCYVCLEQVIQINDKMEALCPFNYKYIDASLDYLLLRRKQGQRAILMYCILHSGAKDLKLLEAKDPNLNYNYLEKVKYAMQQGVEIIAYKASINTQEIKIYNKMSIEFQEIAKL